MKGEDEIRDDFHEEASKVWSNYYRPTLHVEIRRRTTQDVPLMSIRAGHRDYRTKAIGLHLMYKVPEMTLRVTDDSLEMSDEQYRALLRHEALHMGYPRHDQDFKYYAKKVNAPISEFAASGEEMINLQAKHGSRFVTVEQLPYDQMTEARQWMRDYSREHKVKTRITY